MRLTLPATLVLQVALAAQTFVVDAANGPGTNFTSLPSAAAAVPDGAVLLVRQGAYAGFTISQKGLTVLADTGTTISGTIEVTNTASHQPFVLRNVSWPAPPANAPCVRLSSCAGFVLLEGLSNTGWPSTIPVEPRPLDAANCSQFVLRESTLSGWVSLDGIVGVIERCHLIGTSASGFLLPRGTSPGMSVSASNLQIVESLARGGSGTAVMPGFLRASDGIDLQSTSLRLLASTVIAGTDGTGQQYSISGIGSNARIDSLTSLQGRVAIATQFLTMPRLTALGAPVGGTLQATVRTENGDLVVLAVGLPGAPRALRGFQDRFWIDPVVHVYQAIGVQSAGVPITGSIAVPLAPGLVGVQLVWHGACFGPVTGQQNTNPGISLVH